jgi:predicted acylesterase/phospholipase RssA
MSTRRSARRARRQTPRIGLALAGGGRNVQPAAPASLSDVHGGTDRSPAHFQSATAKPRTTRSRIGLALAGGGPLGAIYELGALAALAESLEGLDFNDLHAYVGVSSGGFIAAGLANGYTPIEMFRMFIESDSEHEPFDPAVLMRPAFREYFRRATSLPPLLAKSLAHYFSNPIGHGFFASFQRLSHALPTGIFNNSGIGDWLERLFARPGHSNDFRRLGRKLYLVATDLESGATVEFGAHGFDHVPISQAVLASAALPGLFPPVEIDGRHYVDGALKKTLHASVALKEHARLVLCINPLVPFNAGSAAHAHHSSVIEGGLPRVLSQTFRAIIHSRMQVGMGKYDTEFPHADVILFEPGDNDADMFFTNIFSYSSRKRLCEHAYQKTRAELWQRRHELAPVLSRHGVRLALDRVRDPALSLVRSSASPKARQGTAAARAAAALTDCLDDLDRWLKLAA